jgi:hypothetical protein
VHGFIAYGVDGGHVTGWTGGKYPAQLGRWAITNGMVMIGVPAIGDAPAVGVITVALPPE